MVNSTLAPRRVATAVGLALTFCLSACTTSVPPSAQVSKNPALARPSSGTATAGNDSGQNEKSIYERRVEEFEWNSASRNSHVKRVNYADALLHLGEPRKAIEELVDTELMFPDAYVTAVYLGLAYEMAGDFRSARYWVAKGIERNPEARGGSEWLHLAIIEARLALAQDRKWLETHTVLETNTHRTAEDILNAIRIQLAVRGDFGLIPDAVVCDLYFEAGVCAPSLASREVYFSRSLELGSLRESEIERHDQVRAKGRSTAQVN